MLPRSRRGWRRPPMSKKKRKAEAVTFDDASWLPDALGEHKLAAPLTFLDALNEYPGKKLVLRDMIGCAAKAAAQVGEA